jgi:hypothetical protein
LNNAIVIVQSYVKDAVPQGRIDPQHYWTKRVAIPTIGSAATTLDYPAVRTRMYRSKFRGSAMNVRGEEVYGVIISVFSEDKKLLYQEVSERGLGELALATFPEETDAERRQHLQRAVMAARLKYELAREAFEQGDPENDALQDGLRKAHAEMNRANDEMRKFHMSQ